MIDEHVPKLGIYENETDKFLFSIDDYVLTIQGQKNDVLPVMKCIQPINNFIDFNLYNGQKIKIYMGEKLFKYYSPYKCYISNYIVGNIGEKLECFDSINFEGGTLRNLKIPDQLQTRNMLEDVQFKSDLQSYEFCYNNCRCNVKIASIVTCESGQTGRTIKNNKISLTMQFDKSQDIVSFYTYYNQVCELISFMTCRKNVGFDKITLSKKENKIDRTIASVYIHITSELTEKPIVDNFSFDDLKDILPELSIQFFNEKKYRHLDILFPTNDTNAYLITDERVRNVATAIEYEFNNTPGFKENFNEEVLTQLKSEVQTVVKTYQGQIKEKTFDLINGSINHWSLALCDKIKIMYHKYENEINLLSSNMENIDNAIELFVKYRNNITHGSYKVMDSTVANMTSLLTGLVYCNFLTRMGISRETLIKFCSNHKRFFI